ncbi:MAG: acetoacetate--CoA ligase [Bdellovibrionota bacterium]
MRSNLIDNCLWTPSTKDVQKSNMVDYMNYLKKNNFIEVQNYDELYRWSVEHASEFWLSIWNYCGVISKQQPNKTVDNLNSFKNVNWFPGASLNYSENLLKKNNNDTAIVFRGEDKVSRRLSWKELDNQVSCLQQHFKNLGVKKGDRVAFYMPNIPETVCCVLAVASLGAISSLCSPDFGVQAVVDRFGQIEPTLFIYADEYIYNGKFINVVNKASEIINEISSIKHSFCVSYSNGIVDLLSKYTPQKIEYEYVPFNHPLYIMFSSGTTGVPKCIVHGVGGTLIQHLKEHMLHCNLKKGDVIFYFTTCGWMMWQWLVGALASQSTLLLYDGSPFSPNMEVIFKYLEEENATVFGTSAKYIDSLRKNNFIASEKYPLKNLKIIASTGSPLIAENFDYVYSKIKSNVCLASISGGTDIVSCFVLGNPIGKVYRGEIQTPGLGMKVCVFNDEGKSLFSEKGELVCTLPFPSQPIYFWNDEGRKKYDACYFSKYENVWHHGDWMELTQHGGVIIYGRSDSTLNPNGVRIGTAEIYRQVEQFDEINESVVVEQYWKDENRIVLFVVMKKGVELSSQFIDKIKNKLKTACSPRHVPAKIIAVPAIPRTKSGKIMEIAVKCVINGLDVKNKDAMDNPECLSYFEKNTQLNMD